MYVTRPMSRYLADPRAAAEAAPDGPGSGFLVVVDEAAKELASCCCGLSWDRRVKGLPFPQSRQLALKHSNSMSPVEAVATGVDCLSEVVGSILKSQVRQAPRQPRARAHRLGCVRARRRPVAVVRPLLRCSGSRQTHREGVCVLQGGGQVVVLLLHLRERREAEAVRRWRRLPADGGGAGKRTFRADAVTADGIPPEFLRKKGWSVTISPYKYELADDAHGVNDALRRRTPPDLDDAPPVVVGKWYVPFLFVKADGALQQVKDQAKKSMFYEMTLEQSWEKIFSRTAGEVEQEEVAVTVTVRRRTALLGGTEPAGSPHVDGVDGGCGSGGGAGQGGVGEDGMGGGEGRVAECR